jgi:hypothetical protein
MKNVQRRRPALSLFVLLATASLAAHGFEAIDTLPWPSRGLYPAYPREDDRPTDYWIQGGVLRDDNVLRTEGGERSDTVTRLGAGIRHEQRIVGRQRVRLEARGDFYKYNELSELDHFAYAARGDWLWEVGNQLSGTVSLGAVRRQVDISETREERLDTATELRAGATAGYLITPRFRVRGGVAGSRTERSEARETEMRATSVTLGADYVSPLANTIGLEYRNTNGEAPTLEFVDPLGAFVSNDYREQEISLVATYALGAQLRTGWRLGRTSRDYDQIPGRDFRGTTGRVFVDWLPGTKTILSFEAYREPRSVIDVAASHVLIEGISFGPSWAVTNKLVLSARVVRERRELEGDPELVLVAGTPLRDDRVNLLRFAVGWEPQRRWQVGLGIERGERESNRVGRDYDYSSVMGNLAYVW